MLQKKCRRESDACYTIVPRQKFKKCDGKIGRQQKLSPEDVQKINDYYKCNKREIKLESIRPMPKRQRPKRPRPKRPKPKRPRRRRRGNGQRRPRRNGRKRPNGRRNGRRGMSERERRRLERFQRLLQFRSG